MASHFKEYFIKSNDPYERGRQHGRLAVAEIHDALPHYRRLFSTNGISWDDILTSAQSYVPYLNKHGMEDLIQEVRGIADGSEVPFEEIMALNVRYELMKCPKPFAPGVGFGDVHECTGFLLLPEATESKETISGQNWDMLNFCLDSSYVLHIDEENGTRIVAVCEPGQLLKNGMNNHGLSNTGNNLKSTVDTGEFDGTPMTFMRRRILQQKTFKDAEDIILHSTFHVSMNTMLASREGIACDYEITPDAISKVLPSAGIVGHGNDITLQPNIDADSVRHPSCANHKHFRGQRLFSLFVKKRGHIDIDDIRSALSDHYGYPVSICCHEYEDKVQGRAMQTISSAIYLLDRGYALICKGNPCCGEYVRYDV